MARYETTLYTVTHPRGLRVERVEIRDNSKKLADEGNPKWINHLIAEVRKAYKLQTDIDCGWLEYDELLFTEIQSHAVSC